MPQPLTWGEYVADITGDDTQSMIAERASIHQGTISRWLHVARPRHESRGAVLVIQLARAYDANPVEALVAAGYLTSAEARLEARTTLADVPTGALLRELARRTGEASGDAA